MPNAQPAPIGKRFGQVVVIGAAEARPSIGRMRRQWLVRCVCGTEQGVDVSRLNAGKATSCSRCAKARMRALHRKHGHGAVGRQAPEYFGWCGMRGRCNNPSDKSYPHYGGRGIRVSERWDNFAAFLADMGPKPGPEYSIDRINNDGNYEPGNCRWATAKQQHRNKRSNRHLAFRGRTQCIAAWAEELGIGENVIHHRLNAGYSVEAALGTDVLPGQVLDPDTDGRTAGSFVDRVRLQLLDGERAKELAERLGESHKRVRGALLRLKYRRLITMDRDRRWRRCG